MTVATDLASVHGIKRAIFIRIGGFEPILFETMDDLTPAPSTWTRSVIQCLDPPEQESIGFSFKDMAVNIDGMVFRVTHLNADGTDYFGTLFAPARWDQNAHGRLAEGTTPVTVVNANATTLNMQDTTLLRSSGTGYMGQETITWTGKTASTLTGVTKGLYPAVGSTNYGRTYPRPTKTSAGQLMHVGQVPFSWLGRDVAAYVITWDNQTGAWQAEANAKLFYIGTISREITQEPDGRWRIETNSIVEALSESICDNLPVGQLDKKINLQGDQGRTFVIEERSTAANWPLISTGTITVDKGAYTPKSLTKEINKQIADAANWNTGGGYTSYLYLSHMYLTSDGKSLLRLCSGNSGTGAQRNVWIYPIYKGYPCHALRALGFTWATSYVRMFATIETSTGQVYQQDINSDEEKWVAYHPLNRACNGSKLYVVDDDVFVTDQGDTTTTTQACIAIDDAVLSETGGGDNIFQASTGQMLSPAAQSTGNGTYFARYTSMAGNVLTLTKRPGKVMQASGYVGQKWNTPAVNVQQAFIPWVRNPGSGPRGPFQLLLHTLTSTGTPGYNAFSGGGDYDTLPYGWGLGVQTALIDEASFLRADKQIGPDPLANRYGYVVAKGGEGVTWMELFQREAPLFGYGLTQRNGKLTVVPVMEPGLFGADLTIGEATSANPEDWPEMKQPMETVINQYKCEILYDHSSGKYGPPIFLTDADSKQTLKATHQVEIKHQGIWLDNKITGVKTLLKSSLLRRWIRFPSPLVSESLLGHYFTLVYPGDIVIYSTTRVMDPFGTGTYSVSCYATVLDLNWTFPDFVASMTLLLHTRDAGFGNPWGPSALIDYTENGGDYDAGWDPVAFKLKLLSLQYGQTGDNEDGSAFQSGDLIIIVERAPSDPTSVAFTWGPITLDANYSAASNELPLPNGTTLTGWDNTREYVVLFADHASATTSMKTRGTYQANKTTELLSSNAYADRYG